MYDNFTDGKPWLLRFFDRLRFYPVSHEELIEWRRKLPFGGVKLEIEKTTFRLKEYHAFLQGIAPEIKAAKARHQVAPDGPRDARLPAPH